MAVENFALIDNAIKKVVSESLQNQAFNFNKFIYEMEEAFSALGFRDSDDLAVGGMEDILIVDFHEVGDFILSTPAIREIRRNYPFASITLVTNKRVQAFADNCPYVNNILYFDDRYITRNILDYMTYVSDFAKKNLWKNRYRLAFHLAAEPNFFHQFFMYLSGAKERVGYVLEVNRVYTDNLLSKEQSPSFQLLTRPFVYPKQVVHEIERNLYLLEAYNLQVQSNYPEVWYNASDLFQAKNLLKNFGKGKIKVAVGLGASQNESRSWQGRYPIFLKSIVDKGAALILIGGKAEVAWAKAIQAKLPADSVKNLCELDLSWTVSAAAISQADMYLGNDTGAMHCAAACHLPVVVLSREAKDRPAEFDGISAYYRFFPWQTNAIVLQPEHPLDDCVKLLNSFSTSTCNHNNQSHCINSIPPEEVVAAYEKMVDFMKTIKEIKPSPVIRSIDQVTELYSDQNV